MVVGFLMIIGECCDVEVELRNVACRILISSSPCCVVVVVNTGIIDDDDERHTTTSVSSERACRPSKLTQNERNKEPFYCRKIFYRR